MKVKFGLSVGNIEFAIKEAKKYKRWMHRKSKLFVQRLAEAGVEIASIRFAESAYDGVNDVSVTYTPGKGLSAVVKATGSAVLFIEFGTGVQYSAQEHPLAGELGYTRGTYGHGYGSNEHGWWYRGSSGGTNAHPTGIYKNGKKVGVKEGSWHTYGNPANMALYGTIKELQELLYEIAEEVFRT